MELHFRMWDHATTPSNVNSIMKKNLVVPFGLSSAIIIMYHYKLAGIDDGLLAIYCRRGRIHLGLCIMGLRGRKLECHGKLGHTNTKENQQHASIYLNNMHMSCF